MILHEKLPLSVNYPLLVSPCFRLGGRHGEHLTASHPDLRDLQAEERAAEELHLAHHEPALR